jgi:predicted PhzF superfamily epimerase YddE/YHI9
VIVTLRWREVDFVSRFFATKLGTREDPVIGSALCVMTPYCSARPDKQILSARQVSKHCGDIQCELKRNTVALIRQAVTFMEVGFFV